MQAKKDEEREEEREEEWSRELEKLKVGDSREFWAKLRSMAGIEKGGS